MSDYRYTVKHPGEDVLYSGTVRESAVEAYLSVSSLNEPAIRVERLVQTCRGDHWVTSTYEDIVEAGNVTCESLQRRAAGTAVERAVSEDQSRYASDSWERTKHEALAVRASEPSPRAEDRERSGVTLVPGIAKMSLRGNNDDVERLVTAMRDVGIVVWRADSPGTRTGNDAGYRYFTVEVPSGDGNG